MPLFGWGEMAPTVNLFVKKAREMGATIIHCPSDTLEFYKDTPQRLLAKNAPVVATKTPLMRWCKLDPTAEEKLPIDDTDGGDDSIPKCKNYRAWTRQIDAIEIYPQDAITDSAEAFYLMKQKVLRMFWCLVCIPICVFWEGHFQSGRWCSRG